MRFFPRLVYYFYISLIRLTIAFNSFYFIPLNIIVGFIFYLVGSWSKYFTSINLAWCKSFEYSYFYPPIYHTTYSSFYPTKQKTLRSFSYERKKKDTINTPLIIYFLYKDLLDNSCIFIPKLLAMISPDIGYLVYIKFKFPNQTFRMAGHQFYFGYKLSNLENIHSLRKRTLIWLDLVMDTYGFIQYPEVILFYFKVMSGELKPIRLYNLGIFIPKIAKTKLYNFNKPLPLTIDSRKYGIPLIPIFDKNNIISFKKPDFLDGGYVLENFILNYFNLSMKGLIKIPFNINDSYFLLDNSFLVLLKTDLNKETKYLFDTSATHINTVTDTKIDYKNFTRNIGNVTIVIKNNVVVDYSVNLQLSCIKPSFSKVMDISNPMFGTIDFETYPSNDSINKIYAAGFYTKDNLSTFYIDKTDLNSEKVILDCFDAILLPKYNKFVFYAHNLSGYDGPFILKCLLDYNKNFGSIVYDIDTFFRDGRIMSMVICKKLFDGKKSKNIKITLLDSYLMLTNSLSKLGDSFDVDVVKGIFPHDFANAYTLFYKGDTPKKFYFKDIKDEDYIKLFSNDWDFKKECLLYLKKDLISLFLIMEKFKKNIHINYGVEVLNCPTISRLALDIFMANYYKNNIALISNMEIWSFIKEGYYGGLSEVYKPFGTDLYYYDVNSLYPFAALNDMPGLSWKYQDFLNNDPDINSLFGFYYSEVETSNNYLGLLPFRTSTGSVLLANGKWSSIYFSEELKFAKENGYKIKVKYGYTFNKESNVFSDYIRDLYKTKVESVDKVNRNISKSLLNNLLGRWGMNITKPVTAILNDITLEDVSKTRIIVNTIPICEDSNLTTFYPEVSKEICEDFSVNFISALEKKLVIKSLTKTKKFPNVNISISAAVNSYARVYMGKIKLDLIRKGYTLYYTDTDSLVIDKPLDETLVGTRLGQFKLEYRIKRGYFISSKLYCLVTYNEDPNKSLIIKTKSADSTGLNESHFLALLYKKSIKIPKKQSHILYDKGSVNITNITVVFDANAYKNRFKVYNSEGLWVDTQPHYINTNNPAKPLAIILYKPIPLSLILYKPIPLS